MTLASCYLQPLHQCRLASNATHTHTPSHTSLTPLLPSCFFQIAITPLFTKSQDTDTRAALADAAATIHKQLTAAGFKSTVDDRDYVTIGAKRYHWERKVKPPPITAATNHAGSRTLHTGCLHSIGAWGT